MDAQDGAEGDRGNVNDVARMSLTGSDKDEFRRRETIAPVAWSLDIKLDSAGRGHCPFHHDRHPSFTVWTDNLGVERWGCFPCGLSGDVFDLVRLVKHVTFGDAVTYVQRVASEYSPRPTRQQTPTEFDAVAAHRYVTDAWTRAERSEGHLCIAAGLADDDVSTATRLDYDAFLVALGWGVDEEFNVVIPHRDGAGTLVGVKIRSLGGQKWSFPGSKYDSLYGAWRSLTGDTLVLCEGETDFAYTAFLTQFDPTVDVLALPRGAHGPKTSWTPLVESYRHVVVAFDADEAGDKAAAQWSTYLLRPPGNRPEHSVTRFRPPEGEDMRQSKPSIERVLVS